MPNLLRVGLGSTSSCIVLWAFWFETCWRIDVVYLFLFFMHVYSVLDDDVRLRVHTRKHALRYEFVRLRWDFCCGFRELYVELFSCILFCLSCWVFLFLVYYLWWRPALWDRILFMYFCWDSCIILWYLVSCLVIHVLRSFPYLWYHFFYRDILL